MLFHLSLRWSSFIPDFHQELHRLIILHENHFWFSGPKKLFRIFPVSKFWILTMKENPFGFSGHPKNLFRFFWWCLKFQKCHARNALRHFWAPRKLISWLNKKSIMYGPVGIRTRDLFRSWYYKELTFFTCKGSILPTELQAQKISFWNFYSLAFHEKIIYMILAYRKQKYLKLIRQFLFSL